jgi:hypothetical protein
VDRDAGLDRGLVLEIDQARPAAPRLDREPPQNLYLPFTLKAWRP